MDELVNFLKTHWQLSGSFMAIALLWLILEILNAFKERAMETIDVNNAIYLINNEKALVIDIRAEASFKAGHITGAIHYNGWDKLQKYKNKPLIVVCERGISARKIALELSKQGFNAKLLAGGLTSWMNQGLPLIKG